MLALLLAAVAAGIGIGYWRSPRLPCSQTPASIEGQEPDLTPFFARKEAGNPTGTSAICPCSARSLQRFTPAQLAELAWLRALLPVVEGGTEPPGATAPAPLRPEARWAVTWRLLAPRRELRALVSRVGDRLTFVQVEGLPGAPAVVEVAADGRCLPTAPDEAARLLAAWAGHLRSLAGAFAAPPGSATCAHLPLVARSATGVRAEMGAPEDKPAALQIAVLCEQDRGSQAAYLSAGLGRSGLRGWAMLIAPSP